MSKQAVYTHGHHESVLRSHSWRTAENSAAYLLPYLKPNMTLLDIGCGPGTITADFAKILSKGHVTGLEVPNSDILEKAALTPMAEHVPNGCSISSPAAMRPRYMKAAMPTPGMAYHPNRSTS
ncbi:hypothetical protein NUW54_g14118 [Trametes sanguinea]|uniref:Uncharacterized protein n=1 Tax=Trametes sanguinea TaxID=158606 RepID=A0ACC1MF77_9APHY|nr:hypothetical protein NUW54_g14118 [Trametes sanguinea]